MKVEFIRSCHSIPDSVALAIHTPVGIIVHTGDFKIDYTPIDGELTDFARFAELGRKGVLVMLADSTNVERKGYTMSERVVGDSFLRLFQKAQGRIIVATFASNVHRIQQIHYHFHLVPYDNRVHGNPKYHHLTDVSLLIVENILM